jgi:hypothetical protein
VGGDQVSFTIIVGLFYNYTYCGDVNRGSIRMSYEEEDTCMSYEEEDTGSIRGSRDAL